MAKSMILKALLIAAALFAQACAHPKPPGVPPGDGPWTWRNGAYYDPHGHPYYYRGGNYYDASGVLVGAAVGVVGGAVLIDTVDYYDTIDTIDTIDAIDAVDAVDAIDYW